MPSIDETAASKSVAFTLDLVSRASEACVGEYCLSKQEFRPPGTCKRAGGCSSCQELKDKDPSAPLRRRIVAVSEGRHNGVRFKPDEIEAMVKRALGRDASNAEGGKASNLHVPLILDHSGAFMDKVGSAYHLQFGKHPDDGRPAAIADVEFWSSTPMLREVAERVRLDPENTFFSVRVRGELKAEPEGEYLSNMSLVHIAPVNEPADPKARLISELSASDLPLNSVGPEVDATRKDLRKEGTMTEKDLEALKKEHEEELAKLKAQREAEVEELKKAHETKLKEIRELEAKRSEIIALDQTVDRDFLLSLSGEQLARYKADLEKRLTERELKEKARAGAGPKENPFELAEKYFGKVGV